MDAPPAHEDCRPFVQVAGLMADAGLNVPRVLAEDFARGFLLLSDLGTAGYLQALNADTRGRVVSRRDRRADALAAREPARRAAAVRPSAAARELMLFPDWYVGAASRHDARCRAERGARLACSS